MSKDVLFWVGVKSPFERDKTRHGDFTYLDISAECWSAWCEKNNVVFFKYQYEDVGLLNTELHRATWQRWFDVFNVLDKNKIEYRKIAVIDGSTLIKWDTPNFFELVPETGLTVFKSHENLRWVTEGVDGYKKFFGDFEFDLQKYFSCGFQIFGKDHRPFLEKLKKLYDSKYPQIMDLQNRVVKRGTDQPIYNYMAQIENIEINLDVLPSRYFVTHMYRFDWLGHNWQLNDQTPHFIKHSNIWFFSGMVNRGERYDIMKQVWEAIKHTYEIS